MDIRFESYGTEGYPVGGGVGRSEGAPQQIPYVLQHFYKEANAAQEFKRVLSDAVITGVGFMYSGWRNTAAHLDGTLDKRRLNCSMCCGIWMDIDPNRENDRYRIWTRWGEEDLAATAYGWMDDGLADEIRNVRSSTCARYDKKKPPFLRNIRSNMSAGSADP
jgi:hypothetical protein